MTFATKIDGAWVALAPYQPATVNGISASWATLMAWSSAEREAFGLFEVPEPPAPAAGKYEKTRVLKPTGAKPSWDVTYADLPPPVAPVAPDNPTLGDWRVALLLWGRLSDIQAKVSALKAAGNPLGAVADERMNYSNNVLRGQLLQLKDVFGFTSAEVEESLWRASQVAQGDLSGVWPLPASGA